MLKRVSIQNFKSLKDVTLDLQKVNLLIGPNNSGKTNFLKALEFFGDSHMPNINELELDNQKIGIDQALRNAQRSHKPNPKYSFKDIVFKKQAGNEINMTLSLSSSDSTVRIGIVRWSNEKKTFEQYIDGQYETTYMNNIDAVRFVTSPISPVTIYKPDPNKLIQPGPIGEEIELVNADASNLVNFLDLMLGKYRRTTFNRIEHDLEKCVPEFDEVNLDNVTATDGLKKLHGNGKAFRRLGLTNSKQGITYWADELSEGTLYFLALLCIINQPNPPKLLLLEEPEKGIHPRRIWEVMKFIFQLAEEKDIQIILTTHNEHVVNAFSSSPESIFIFDKDEEGATYVRNLQKDIIEPSHQKSEEMGLDKIDFTENLGDNWLYGLIGGVPANDL